MIRESAGVVVLAHTAYGLSIRFYPVWQKLIAPKVVQKNRGGKHVRNSRLKEKVKSLSGDVIRLNMNALNIGVGATIGILAGFRVVYHSLVGCWLD